jgi:hypothetical protein
MRVFLCAFKGFSIAIPMDSIASVALHASESTEYGETGGETAISLPELFNLSEELIRHIIILKPLGGEDKYTEGNNIILLTTEIECEIDISDQRIFPLPKALSATRFSALFTGIQFNTHQLLGRAGGMILLLNCEELNRFTQKGEAL